jgi:hypothetical protein
MGQKKGMAPKIAGLQVLPALRTNLLNRSKKKSLIASICSPFCRWRSGKRTGKITGKSCRFTSCRQQRVLLGSHRLCLADKILEHPPMPLFAVLGASIHSSCIRSKAGFSFTIFPNPLPFSMQQPDPPAGLDPGQPFLFTLFVLRGSKYYLAFTTLTGESLEGATFMGSSLPNAATCYRCNKYNPALCGGCLRFVGKSSPRCCPKGSGKVGFTSQPLLLQLFSVIHCPPLQCG